MKFSSYVNQNNTTGLHNYKSREWTVAVKRNDSHYEKAYKMWTGAFRTANCTLRIFKNAV